MFVERNRDDDAYKILSTGPGTYKHPINNNNMCLLSVRK